MVLAVLGAALLRGHALDAMSLWTDEGLSFYRATKDLGFLMSGRIDVGLVPTQDVQPPLYFLLLAGWFKLVGVSPWAGKWFSLLASLPVVVLVGALGRRLVSRNAGLVAAAFAALSPAYLWYAQEVRHYTLLVALGLGAMATLAVGLGLPAWPSAQSSRPQSGASGRASVRRRWLAASAVLGALVVWTHYLGFFLVAVQAFVAALFAAAPGRRGRPWLAGLALAAAVAAAPLVPFAVGRLRLGAERDQHFVPFHVMLLDVPRGFTLGLTADHDALRWILAPLVAVLLLGLWGLARRRGWSALVLGGYLAVPVVGLFALTLIKPVYMGVRHILSASPAYYLLLAAGLSTMARWGNGGRLAAGLGAASIAGGMALSAWAFHSEPAYAKDDLRALAAYVSARAVPGDALVLSDPVLKHVFDVYLAGVPGLTVTSAPMTGLDEPLGAQLEGLLASHDRLWLMTPHDDVIETLSEQARMVDRASFGGKTIPVRAAAWERPAGPPGAPPEVGADGERADTDLAGLRVLAWTASPQPLVAGTGGRVHVQIAVPGAGATADVNFAVRLIGADGESWADGDHAPFHGRWPVADWPAGDTVRLPQDLLVSPATPPGRYDLTIVAYDPATGREWPGDGPLLLGSVDVAPPPAPALEVAVPSPMSGRAGGWEIVGYDVVGGPWPEAEALAVRIWLRRRDASPEPKQLEVALVPARGEAGSAVVPLPPDTPVGHVRRLKAVLTAPEVPGPARLVMRLVDPAGAPQLIWRGRPAVVPSRELLLAQGEIEARPAVETVPPDALAVGATFGAFAELAAFDAPPRVASGGALTVRLHWRAVTSEQAGYHVSVQLLPPPDAADHRPVAQSDGPPARGLRPTTGWRVGEVVTDEHELQVAPGTPAGTYRLAVTMYDPAGGHRLAVAGAGTLAGESLVELAVVAVDDGGLP